MTNYEKIKHAIENKLIIIATHDEFRRKLCPHVMGTKGENDRKKCLFYQFGGGSKSGISIDHAKNWRCIYIDELSGVEVVSGEWHTSKNHSTRSTCIDRIEMEISL